jgi:prepilin-type N-terminal cleavage/methylation domain-containing protein
MKKSQSGFTLIELVVVIVLLGILGVTALGKFEDLSADAADAATKGIAGELSSAASINYAARLVNPSKGETINTADCTSIGGAPGAALDSLMATGSAPTDNLTYAFVSSRIADTNVTSEEDAVCASGDSFTCSIVDSRGTSSGSIASFICTG